MEVKSESVKAESIDRQKLAFSAEKEDVFPSLDQQVQERQAEDEEVMKTQNLLEELEDVHEGNEAVNKPTMKEKKYDKDGLSITDDEDGEEEKKEDEVPLPPKKKREFVASPEGEKSVEEKAKKSFDKSSAIQPSEGEVVNLKTFNLL